jgi:hypothetical protein
VKRAINLVGRVFGRLTVLVRAGSTDRAPPRPLWRCRCACGEETVVLAESLRAGRTRSCGCLRAEIARELSPRSPSLVGEVFGRLTVLARAESTDRARRASWRCRCACGQETIVQGHSLRGGRTRSCGCLRAELARASIAAVLARRQRGPRSAAAAIPSAISMSPPQPLRSPSRPGCDGSSDCAARPRYRR